MSCWTKTLTFHLEPYFHTFNINKKYLLGNSLEDLMPSKDITNISGLPKEMSAGEENLKQWTKQENNF